MSVQLPIHSVMLSVQWTVCSSQCNFDCAVHSAALSVHLPVYTVISSVQWAVCSTLSNVECEVTRNWGNVMSAVDSVQYIV